MTNVAIDGPAGAGKSTIAKAAAKELGFIYVDTGALYRAVAYNAVKNGVIDDEQGIISMLDDTKVELKYVEGVQSVYLNGEDVSGFIRTPEISMGASKVSAIPQVREFLLNLQREIAKTNNVIMDGRDIATVVLPDAEVKIFLFASPECRAERRYKEQLAPLIPHRYGSSLLIDCGANVDAKPENLVQFAKMGSIYMKNIEGIENPRVGIINIGAEDEKGNELVKSTIPLLRECKDINFIGSVESRDIPNGPADVLVCEAFVGNVLLKFFEGLGKMFMAEIKDTLKSSVKTKIGGALIYKPIKKTFKRYMADDKGGAPLLGLKGLVVKIHGNSKDTEVRSAIEQCRNFMKKDVTNQIIRTFVEEENKGEN